MEAETDIYLRGQINSMNLFGFVELAAYPKVYKQLLKDLKRHFPDAKVVVRIGDNSVGQIIFTRKGCHEVVRKLEYQQKQFDAAARNTRRALDKIRRMKSMASAIPVAPSDGYLGLISCRSKEKPAEDEKVILYCPELLRGDNSPWRFGWFVRKSLNEWHVEGANWDCGCRYWMRFPKPPCVPKRRSK